MEASGLGIIETLCLLIRIHKVMSDVRPFDEHGFDLLRIHGVRFLMRITVFSVARDFCGLNHAIDILNGVSHGSECRGFSWSRR